MAAFDVEDTEHLIANLDWHGKFGASFRKPVAKQIARLAGYVVGHQRLSRAGNPADDPLLTHSQAIVR